MDNTLKKIISDGIANLSKIFHSEKASTSVIGIDIGSSSIKVVQLGKKGGKAMLETYGELALGPYGNLDIGVVTNLAVDDVVRALADVIKESNVTVRNGAIAIPSSSTLMFTIPLPAKITEAELASVVPIEARKYIPLPITEVSMDWFQIPDESSSFENTPGSNSPTAPTSEPKIEVLVVAIHNDVLTRYQEILKKSEIVSDSLEVEVFSNIRASFGHDVAPVLLMDFGASKTKLSIIEAGVVRVFHVVNRGSAEITRNISSSMSIPFPEAEKLKRTVGLDVNNDAKVAEIIRLSVDYIFSDTNSVVLAYEKKYNKNISKVVLSGGGSLMKGLFEKATENFRTEVVYSNPFSKTEAPAFLEPVLKASGPEFAVAVGLALRQLS